MTKSVVEWRYPSTVRWRSLHSKISSKYSNNETLAGIFRDLILKEKIKSSLNLLSCKTTGGILNLEDRNNSRWHSPILFNPRCPIGKASPGNSPASDSLLNGISESIDLIFFENLNAEAIQHAALHTHRAAGLHVWMPTHGNVFVHLSQMPLKISVLH